MPLVLRDGRSVEIVEQVKHPETWHERYVKTLNYLLLQRPPFWYTKRLNSFLRTREKLLSLQRVSFNMSCIFGKAFSRIHLDISRGSLRIVSFTAGSPAESYHGGF